MEQRKARQTLAIAVTGLGVVVLSGGLFDVPWPLLAGAAVVYLIAFSVGVHAIFYARRPPEDSGE